MELVNVVVAVVVCAIIGVAYALLKAKSTRVVIADDKNIYVEGRKAITAFLTKNGYDSSIHGSEIYIDVETDAEYRKAIKSFINKVHLPHEYCFVTCIAEKTVRIDKWAIKACKEQRVTR